MNGALICNNYGVCPALVHICCDCQTVIVINMAELDGDVASSGCLELQKENQSLKCTIEDLKEDILYWRAEVKRTEQRYLKHLNMWKQKHNEACEQLRSIKPRVRPSLGVVDTVQPTWETDSDEVEVVQHSKTPLATSSQKRKPLKRLQLGQSLSKEKLKKAGLPPYACKVTFRKKCDRDKLPAFPCDDCHNWYEENESVGVLPTDTCRHRELYPRPVTPPGVWDIGFPDSPK